MLHYYIHNTNIKSNIYSVPGTVYSIRYRYRRMYMGFSEWPLTYDRRDEDTKHQSPNFMSGGGGYIDRFGFLKSYYPASEHG
jgi:hypothetical protein